MTLRSLLLTTSLVFCWKRGRRTCPKRPTNAEERIVNAACTKICSRLELGDYRDFAKRWKLADMDNPEDPADQALVSEIVDVVMAAINKLKPQSADRLLKDLKASAEHSIEPGTPRL